MSWPARRFRYLVASHDDAITIEKIIERDGPAAAEGKIETFLQRLELLTTIPEGKPTKRKETSAETKARVLAAVRETRRWSVMEIAHVHGLEENHPRVAAMIASAELAELREIPAHLAAEEKEAADTLASIDVPTQRKRLAPMIEHLMNLAAKRGDVRSECEFDLTVTAAIQQFNAVGLDRGFVDVLHSVHRRRLRGDAPHKFHQDLKSLHADVSRWVAFAELTAPPTTRRIASADAGREIHSAARPATKVPKKRGRPPKEDGQAEAIRDQVVNIQRDQERPVTRKELRTTFRHFGNPDEAVRNALEKYATVLTECKSSTGEPAIGARRDSRK